MAIRKLITKEEVNCTKCGSADMTLAPGVHGVTLLKCRACGHEEPQTEAVEMDIQEGKDE